MQATTAKPDLHNLQNLDHAKAAARNHGSHWFEPSTMSFFQSRLLSPSFSAPSGVRLYCAHTGRLIDQGALRA